MGVFQDEIPQGTGSLDEGGGTRCTWEMKGKDFDRNKLDTSLKFNSSPLKSYQDPIGKDSLPIIRFEKDFSIFD